MEDLVSNFPLLSRKIFNKLNNQDVTKAREAGRFLYSYLKNDRLIWIRRLQKYNKNHIEFKEVWKSATKKVPAENVKELAIAAEQFYAVGLQNLEFQHSPMRPLIKESNGKTGVKVSLRHL